MKSIDWFVYEPSGWQKTVGYTVDIDYCRYQVSEGGRSVGFRQCCRKPFEVIQGYGFCKQHAKSVRAALGNEDTIDGPR